MRPGDSYDLKELRDHFPEAKTLQDIISSLKKMVDPSDKGSTVICRKSKSSFTVSFEKGLCTWGKFLFNKSIMKRIV